jgi:DNA mismatch repair ATPase MutS
MDIFIPNDTLINGDTQDGDSENGEAKIQILSGANFSGKSIYLKQVQLIY